MKCYGALGVIGIIKTGEEGLRGASSKQGFGKQFIEISIMSAT